MSRWTVAAELQALSRSPRPAAPPQRHNPRPPGRICAGSTTHSVLVWLASQPPRRWWALHEIAQAVQRPARTVSWSIAYLQAMTAVEAITDNHRNPRYLRYRFRQEYLDT